MCLFCCTALFSCTSPAMLCVVSATPMTYTSGHCTQPSWFGLACVHLPTGRRSTWWRHADRLTVSCCCWEINCYCCLIWLRNLLMVCSGTSVGGGIIWPVAAISCHVEAASYVKCSPNIVALTYRNCPYRSLPEVFLVGFATFTFWVLSLPLKVKIRLWHTVWVKKVAP